MKTLCKLVCALNCALALGSGAASADQWAKTYGNAAAQTGTLIPIGAGGFYLLGTTTSAATAQDSLYGRIDAAGGVLWAKQLGGAKNDALGVQSVADGFLVTGMTKSFPDPGYARDNLLWAKFDTAWNPVYVNVFGINGMDESGGFNRVGGGGMLFAGTRTRYPTPSTSDRDILLIKTRVDGSIQWRKAFDFGLDDSVDQVFELSDGYLVAGMLQDPVDDTWGILLLKLAKGNGAVLAKTLYTFDSTGTTMRLGAGASFTMLADGNFLIFGTLQQLNPLLGGIRTMLAKIDPAGAILWSRSYGSSTKNVTASTVNENPVDQTLLVSGPVTVADFTSPNFGNASILALTLNPATGAIVQQRQVGAPSEYNSGSIIRSGTVLYFSGLHALNFQQVAANSRIAYGRLNPTNFNAFWANAFGGPEREFGGVVRIGGVYDLTGTTFSFGNSTASRGDLFGMTLDATGNYPNCFIDALTLTTAGAGLTAQALTLLTSSPTLDPVAVNNTLTTAVLPVADVVLPSTDFCSPIASAR